MATCSIIGCERDEVAKGLCRSHYNTKRNAEASAQRRAIVRVCRTCGEQFSGRDPRAIFCSIVCKERSRNPGRQENTGNCAECGVSLAGKRVDAIYCNDACLQRHKIRQGIAVRNATKRCAGCDGEMPTLKHGKARYCSAECRIRSRRHRV